MCKTRPEVYALDYEHGPDGVSVHLDIAKPRFHALKERRRNIITGRAHRLRPVRRGQPGWRGALPQPGARGAPLAAPRPSLPPSNSWIAISRCAGTGAAHAAAWVNLAGDIELAREDVGRHNALDKLIGARAKAGADNRDGFALVSSRASYEMVQNPPWLASARWRRCPPPRWRCAWRKKPASAWWALPSAQPGGTLAANMSGMDIDPSRRRALPFTGYYAPAWRQARLILETLSVDLLNAAEPDATLAPDAAVFATRAARFALTGQWPRWARCWRVLASSAWRNPSCRRLCRQRRRPPPPAAVAGHCRQPAGRVAARVARTGRPAQPGTRRRQCAPPSRRW